MRFLLAMAAVFLAGCLLMLIQPLLIGAVQTVPIMSDASSVVQYALREPELYRHLAEFIVCCGLAIEAWAIWQHARGDEHRFALRTAATMFIVAAGCGATALVLDTTIYSSASIA